MAAKVRQRVAELAQERTVRTIRWVAVLVFVVTFVAFVPALWAGFATLDDPGILLEVTGWRGLGPSNFAWIFTTTNQGHYEPLTYLSFAIDYMLWGIDSAFGYHLTSLLVHSLDASLLVVLAVKLIAISRLREPRATPQRPETPAPDWPIIAGAGAAALFWGIHPLRVESAAWITERRDVLSGLFLLLATLSYIRAFPAGSVRSASRRDYWMTLLYLFISLLCKAWGITFFAVLLVLDLYPLRRMPASRPWHWFRREFRPVLWQKLPFAALGAAFAWVAAYAQGSVVATVHSLSQWGVTERSVQSAYGLMFYLWKTAVPTGLAALYELPVKLNPAEPRFLAAFAIVGAAVVVAIVLRRRMPGVAAALAIYAITVSPVLGILQSGIQFVADRYSYISTISVCVLLGAGVSDLLRRNAGASAARARLRAWAFVGAALAVTLIGLSWRQISFWKSGDSLFGRVLAVGWDGPVTRNCYGRQFEERSKDRRCPDPRALKEKAAEQYRIGLSMNPTDGENWYALANVRRDLGQTDEARKAYEQAARLLPQAWKAYVGIGILDVNANDLPHAKQMFEAAVADVERADRPRGAEPGGGGVPYLMLAMATDLLGDPRTSRELLIKASQYEPVRQRALERLAEVEAEIRGQR